MLALLLIVGAVTFGGGAVLTSAAVSEVDYSGIKTAEDRIRFMESFGIRVEGEAEEESFLMPESFDRVILGYNELQKRQGLDISRYSKKRVTRYTYKVSNFDSDGEVYASLFIYRGTVVACDVSSADPEGFVIPMTLIDKSKLK